MLAGATTNHVLAVSLAWPGLVWRAGLPAPWLIYHRSCGCDRGSRWVLRYGADGCMMPAPRFVAMRSGALMHSDVTSEYVYTMYKLRLLNIGTYFCRPLCPWNRKYSKAQAIFNHMPVQTMIRAQHGMLYSEVVSDVWGHGRWMDALDGRRGWGVQGWSRRRRRGGGGGAGVGCGPGGDGRRRQCPRCRPIHPVCVWGGGAGGGVGKVTG